jgi:polyisoprenoid-binding protein YceI
MSRAMLRPLACLLLVLVPVLPAAAQRITAIDYGRSEIRFVGKQMGVPAEGRFGKFSARLDFDPAKPAAAKASVEIDLNSFDTGTPEVDTEVKRKPWLNVAVFPTATFVSTAIKPLGGNRYEVAGKLTIKGQTRDLSAPFSVRKDGDATILEGAFTLLRLQFGIGAGPWADTETVADEVQVHFRLAGVPKG